MVIAKLDRKNRLVTMLVDHTAMTFIIFLLLAPVVVMNIFNLVHTRGAANFLPHFGIYEVFGFSLYFNRDIFQGRSIGKRTMGFQILNNKTGPPAGPLRCLIRNLTIFLWPVEVVASLVNVNRRIGDYFAGTRLEVYDRELQVQPHWSAMAACILLATAFTYAVLFYPMELLMNAFLAQNGAHA